MPYSAENAFATVENAKQLCQVQLRALRGDLAILSDMRNRPDKVAYKRETLIPKYQDYIDRYIESGLQHPNEVFSYFVVWHFDTGELETAFTLALIAIDQQQPMPDRFKRRDVVTFVCDEILRALDFRVDQAETIFQQALSLIETDAWAVIPEIKAKFFKVAGTQAEMNKAIETAVAYYEKADACWGKAQVKTKLDKLRKQLEKGD
ncbi:phage terminase small subunit [Spartinivicinus ruber]|uniref:phage terminase small subunit n=1 Tax=Spartinivicinus ruber TaxID=2683272 RepID=UPI0013D645A9|nr:phage terminase small subunit [Spartinivicinus ruber]